MAKILIYSPNVIGKSMAGAAIRPWEFAKELSSEHQVILISPGKSEVKGDTFEIISVNDPACRRHFQDADLLIAQRLTFSLAILAKLNRLKIIIDAYVPGPLELLEHFKLAEPAERKLKVFSETTNIIMSLKMADGMLCASEKQKELWIGFLLGQKLITPALYDRDSSLSHFLAVVPFGISSSPPQKKGGGLKEKFSLQPSDKVLLWGGGLWNWFDPISLIKAMARISRRRSDIKLVFMGVKPPDPALPATSMSDQAIRLSEQEGLLNRCVFFNFDWVPYEERQNFLLDADIGVSTHFNHLETRFSFRTRILDYLWAGLPILTSQGDSFAELVERHRLGVVVPYQDEQAIEQSILGLLDDPEGLQTIRANVASLREQYYWNAAIVPLREMIRQLTARPSKRISWPDGKILLEFIGAKWREKGIRACLNTIYKQYLCKKSYETYS